MTFGSATKHTYLNGTLSTHNSRCWGSSRPTEVQEQSLHSKRCTAWCAPSAHGIIGPFWFEDEEGGTLTVTQVNYRNILDKFCAALGQYRQDAWLQQDGAPPHTARLTMAYLQDRFGDRLISKGAEFQWAPHSQDLSVLDFFLWGYAKYEVYKENPQDIPQLKDAIASFIGSIPADMCARAIANFRARVLECIRRRGAHFEHLV